MTAPLSGQFATSGADLATGMFGGKKAIIAPRGAYIAQGVGDPQYVYGSPESYMWNNYADLMSGTSRFGQISTATGVPVGTPEAPDAAATLNVGSMGGNAGYLAGSSPV